MKDTFEEAIQDPDNPCIDINAAGDNVLSMYVRTDENPDGTLVDGTTENVLLYVHELHNFLKAERGAVLHRDPDIAVRPTATPSVYEITVGERPVKSLPSQSDDVLKAVRAAKEDGDLNPLIEVYKEIVDTQVRRDVLNKLIDVLPNIPRERVQITDEGWVVDDYYVVDWKAEMYAKGGPDDTYTRSGDTLDKDHEFLKLNMSYEPERKKVKLDGETLLLGEKEMEFLGKVRFLLDRAEFHEDEPFWRYNEKKRLEYLNGERW